MRDVIISGGSLLLFTFIVTILSFSATPASSLYKVKRLREQMIGYTITQPERKVDYELSLLTIRLEEIEQLIEMKDYSSLLSSTMRYSATAGNLSEYIISNNISTKSANVISVFKSHHDKIILLAESISSKDDGNKYLYNAANYTVIYQEQIESNVNSRVN